MTRLDRYVIGQILGPFGFFALIFTGVIWLTQSLRIIDLVVNNGQSAAVFLEFTALLLPTVMAIVLPIAGFAATLFALHRLYSESELVAMMAAGQSDRALARPVMLFGLGVLVAMGVITTYLMPMASHALNLRTATLRGDIANALIREGQFMNPARGLTIYVRDASRTGEMAGIFIHDTREPGVAVTYTADRAALVRDDGAVRVVMIDGTAQQLDAATGALSTLRFDTFAYDLSALMEGRGIRDRKPSEYAFPVLIDPPADIRARSGFKLGEWVAEGHEQISAPLYALVLPLIAVAFILGGGFRRRGFARQIWAGAAAAVAVRLLGVAAKAVTTGQAELWPLMYLPPVLALLGVVWALGGLWGRTGTARVAT